MHREPNKPKNTFGKIIRKIVVYMFLALFFAIAGLLGLLFLYEDEVKGVVISELNKHLNAEVKISPRDIDLTIIKTFPDCSIQFRNVLMYEALPIKKRDTLLFAKQLNLNFNIKDLWNKKYNIRKIKLFGGVIKLHTFKNGNTNYVFWKEEESTTNAPTQSLSFSLQSVKLERCRLNYKDAHNKFETGIEIPSLDFMGNFRETDYQLNSAGKLIIHELSSGQVNFLKEKTCNFSIDLDVKGESYTFKKTAISLNQLAIELSGGFVFTNSLKTLNIDFITPGVDIVSFLSLLPEKYTNNIKEYKSTGSIYASGNLSYNGFDSFSITSDFGIKNGTITYEPNVTTAKEVNLNGRLVYNKNQSVLTMKDIYLKLREDEISGNCQISDFKNPRINASLRAGLNLSNLQSFLMIDTLSTLKGNLTIDAKVDGLFADIKQRTFSNKVKLDLEASVTNLEVGFKNDDRTFAVENCLVTAANRDIEVKDLKLKRGSSDILLNGKLPGFFNYLADDKAPLMITGNLFANYIKLEDFMVKYVSSGGEGPVIPPNIRFQLNAEITKFSYAKFEANNIKGEIDIKEQKAIISDMKLQTMGGEAFIDAFADNGHQKLDVVLQSKLKNINISHLFEQLNNFGQNTLEGKNIKGFASADIEFSGSWNNKLESNLSSMRSVCNLSIVRGELIDFKPLLSLSRFVEINDLQRIKFADLQSSIRIANSVITFPKTTLKNSALDIDFWGTHSFDNEIDYHIQLLISDLLAKKRKPRDDEFGLVENDRENRRRAFIRMTGTVDKPIMKYDSRGMKEKVTADIKDEKQTIKQLLKEEFGLFKKDSTVKKTNKSDRQFELEKPDNNAPKKTFEAKKKQEDEDF